MIDDLLQDSKHLIDKHIKKPVKTIRVFQPINAHQVLLGFIDDIDLSQMALTNLRKKTDIRIMDATTILPRIEQSLDPDFSDWPQATHALNQHVQAIILSKQSQLRKLNVYLDRPSGTLAMPSQLRTCIVDAQSKMNQDLSNYLIVQPYGVDQLITANVIKTDHEFSIQYNFQDHSFVLPEKKHTAFNELFE